jgi:hypothetical protein
MRWLDALDSDCNEGDEYLALSASLPEIQWIGDGLAYGSMLCLAKYFANLTKKPYGQKGDWVKGDFECHLG